jgi:glycosyltransferase involved in cell wall biosynthesis
MARRLSVLELRSVRGTGGGPEKTILLGAALADRDRFDVSVAYIRDGRDDVFDLARRAAALQVNYVEIPERHSLDPGIWLKLARLVRDRAIDIVHSHEYKTDLLARLLARRRGIVPIATAHGWTGQSWRERHVYYPADKRVLSGFPHVIAVSGDIRAELVRGGTDPSRISVLLNAVDPVAFRRDHARRDAVRRGLGRGNDDLVIGAVGRLERQKRFDILIDVFAALALSRPHAHLVIAGDGGLRSALSAQVDRLGVADRVHLLGHREDIADLHQAFDLFVQSSEYEGTPNAVLEAMAMETPIVATDAGGTAELLVDGEHGVIVPVGDRAALSRAIAAALDQPKAARARAEAARRRVEADLSFEARTRRLEAIYTDLVAEPDPRDRVRAAGPVASEAPRA